MEAARRSAPRNLVFEEPVYGRDKQRVLAGAKAYLQLSRLETFGMSLVEAAAAGVPLILASSVDLAKDAQGAGAAAIIGYPSTDSVRAASTDTERLRKFLADPVALQSASTHARSWAARNFAPAVVAEKATFIYQAGTPS
jgi:glycosyltransferase involved in cell wall biosynthesis